MSDDYYGNRYNRSYTSRPNKWEPSSRSSGPSTSTYSTHYKRPALQWENLNGDVKEALEVLWKDVRYSKRLYTDEQPKHPELPKSWYVDDLEKLFGDPENQGTKGKLLQSVAESLREKREQFAPRPKESEPEQEEPSMLPPEGANGGESPPPPPPEAEAMEEGGTESPGASVDEPLVPSANRHRSRLKAMKPGGAAKGFFHKMNKIISPRAVQPRRMDIREIPSWRETAQEIASKGGKSRFIKFAKTKHYEVNEEFNHIIRISSGSVADVICDGIVNAANEGCMGGAGVDGAIHTAAGPLLRLECSTFDGCETGHCRITKGYNLPAGVVLHAVGPMKEDEGDLESAYKSVLDLAAHHKLESVAFCCISTGIFGYPLTAATRVALRVTREWLDGRVASGEPLNFKQIGFICFRDEEVGSYNALVPGFFPAEGIKVEEVEERPPSPPKSAWVWGGGGGEGGGGGDMYW